MAGLRLTWAALILLLIARPSAASLSGAYLKRVLSLGIATGGMAICYFEAVARLPIAIVTTIEFCGPLGVALVTSRSIKDLICAFVAIAGIACFASGNSHAHDIAGFALAFAAAGCWSVYILLTRSVATRTNGIEGLSLSLSVASLVSLCISIAPQWNHVTFVDLVQTAGIALLFPLIPYAIEMSTLRRLNARTFGILMSLEPAISGVIAWLVLEQRLSLLQLAGVVLVSTASIGTCVERKS